ncbi:MAG TPA: hypothetical protein VGP31_05405 [Planosporangium sp.]|jgi:hypothetical protein|nr:hypothetical protein [Planosporangium sp.]
MVARLLLRWVVMVVAVPLVAALIRWLSRVMEERGGPTRMSALLRRAADALQRERGRGGGRWSRAVVRGYRLGQGERGTPAQR